jgi:hypothetical protein
MAEQEVRRGRWGWVSGLVLSLVLGSQPAMAKALGGVEMPESLDLQGRSLVLEHAGLQEVLFFDLYVWALYLEGSPRSQREAVDSNGGKQLRFHFRRDISREQLIRAFQDFLAGSLVLQSPEMRSHSQVLVRSLRGARKDDRLLITYLPERGLYVSGEASGGALIPGKDFADALFALWLQQHPFRIRD